jgi:hypothetical protein
MFLRYSHKLRGKSSIEMYNSNDLEARVDRWVKFFIKNFFCSTLNSFMHELDNLFLIK